MKTYRALRHDHVRKLQKDNSNILHHPNEKIAQLYSFIKLAPMKSSLHILELFGGYGNLTKEYLSLGETYVLEKDKNKVDHIKNKYPKALVHKADSFYKVYDLILNKKLFGIVDADPYGFPNRLFPHIYLLMEDSLFFVTMPKPYVNILNGITQTHLISYFNDPNPSHEKIVERLCIWGLCHWRQVELLDSIDLGSVWRMCFYVKKVKATEYTGTVNRKQPQKPNNNSKNQNQLSLFDFDSTITKE